MPWPLSSTTRVKAPGFKAQPQPDFGGLGVLDDVVQRLLQRQKQVVTQFGIHAHRRQRQRQVHAATDSRRAQEILGKGGDVVHQPAERVVLRVHRPDDFVHRPGQLPGGTGDALEMRADLVRLAPGQFREQGDLRQARADVIVDVLGDARAVAFDGVLLLQQRQFAAVFPRGGPAHDQRRCRPPATSPAKVWNHQVW